MITCKDCLHSEVCAYIKPDLPICSDFADRSKYVVRKNGEWKLVEFQSSPLDIDQALVCSCCGFAHQYDAWFNRCPNCGAYMRTEEDKYETD